MKIGAPVFNREEIKEFIVKYGKKWFFPDFTNKLTWFVAGIGGTILITPVAFEQLVYNWLVQTINLNSGVPITLAELEEGCADYWLGFGLIFLALAHNIANRYFIYKDSLTKTDEAAAIEEVDKQLFLKFLEEFSSDSRSVSLMKDHDFGVSYHNINTQELDNFVATWNTAERQFLNHELEEKRKALWDKSNEFFYELAQGSWYLNGGPMLSCIPDAYRGAWELPDHVDEKINRLNAMGRECFELHRDLVLFGRRKLKC